MYRHLVSVEVRVECRAHQRVDTNRLALDEHRLESLDAQSVKGRRTVQQNRVILDDVLEDFVNLRVGALHDLLGALDRLGLAALLELVDDERLEQLDRHRLGQATLMQLELRPDYDDRAARVVHALAQQVLPEATLLAFQHVAERLERTLAAATDRLRSASVVEKCVDSLLQHALLIAEDDLRRAHSDELLEPVVPVDDPPVQVVQVRRRETTAVERNERTKIGRNDRNHVHDHPFWTVPCIGGVAGITQRVHDLEPLELLLLPVLGRFVHDLVAQPLGQAVEPASIGIPVLDFLVRGVQQLEQSPRRLGTNLGLELFVVLVSRFHPQIVVLVFVKQVQELHLLLSGMRNHVSRVVDDLL